MKRIATAAVGVPLALAAVFWLPGPWFFLVVLVLIEIAVLEYAGLVGRSAPETPTRALLWMVPVASLVLSHAPWPWAESSTSVDPLWTGALVLSVGVGSLVLLSRVPSEQTLKALGALAFGLPYFALPVASLYQLQRLDPWVLLLLLAIVWMGDAAAYYCGTRWGRRRLAPRVSPRKTWEGAIACGAVGVMAAAAWSWGRLGDLRLAVLMLALVTSVMAQLGDLVESSLKRGAGVKDSSTLLPGHGGVLDRLDALLFAAPTLLAGIHLIGEGSLQP